jgi:hypothetical protein
MQARRAAHVERDVAEGLVACRAVAALEAAQGGGEGALEQRGLDAHAELGEGREEHAAELLHVMLTKLRPRAPRPGSQEDRSGR